MPTCQSLLAALYLLRIGKMSPFGTILTKPVICFQVFGLKRVSGVSFRRNASIFWLQCGTTRISRAITKRHRDIRLFTVEYMERKSVYTTGHTTFRICTLVRPPKKALWAYPMYFLGK